MIAISQISQNILVADNFGGGERVKNVSIILFSFREDVV